MASSQLEQRVAALEAEVIKLKDRLEVKDHTQPLRGGLCLAPPDFATSLQPHKALR